MGCRGSAGACLRAAGARRPSRPPLPVSMTVRPSPSSSTHTLTWSSFRGSGSRTQWRPGSISSDSPGAGGSGKGNVSATGSCALVPGFAGLAAGTGRAALAGAA